MPLFHELELDAARMDNSHIGYDYPTSVTDASSFTHTLYPSHEYQRPNPSINIVQPVDESTSTMVQLESGLNTSPTISDEQLSLELLLAEWTQPGFQTMPDPYSPVAPSEASSASSPMIHNYDHTSQNAPQLAPQAPSGPHLQPSPISPQVASVPIKPVSPSTSPGPRRSRRPDRVKSQSIQPKGRTCAACRTAKAKCQWTHAQSQACVRCAKTPRECVPAETRQNNPTLTIRDITLRIRELEVQIQKRMDILHGLDGQQPLDRPSALESTEGRKCGCPVPASTASAAEGSTTSIAANYHRPGCPASDPMGLYGRSRLMQLQDPDAEAKDNESDDDDMSSEEEERSHDPNLDILLPTSGTPAATFFELARSLASPYAESSSSSTGSSVSADVGLAGADYFTPNPAARPAIRKIMIEREKLPSYLLNGTVKPAECTELFERFMSLWNVSVSVLDPGLHTSARVVLSRCPFLFTVVLAIAARDHKPEHYPVLMDEAKDMAGKALTTWWKSIEIVQAFILLATFPRPSKRWDEDRTWLYLGYATRMAGDLQLNRPAEHPFPNEMAEREHLNRIRTWLICHNLDVSAAAKLGKQTSMQEDPVILGSRTWWKSSKYNMKFDIHLCAFTQICIIFRKYFTLLGADSSSIYSFNNHVDVGLLAERFTKEIEDFQADFESVFTEHSDHNDPACRYRAYVKYTAHYFRLVIYSICHGRSRDSRKGEILQSCLDAASRLVKALSEHHANSVYFKYSAEGWFTFGAFAAAFMVKALCPTFAPVIDQLHRQHLRGLVMELITAYQSKQVAIDERHTPSIYARFLARLLVRADELNGATSTMIAPPPPPASSASPQIKVDSDEMERLFVIPSLHNLG
ncbi:Protein priB [Lentinula edodes] [Rhizoctonia solani]|uniref:Protein priB [Lentinula edodes] n=1 Tax=Rhizoctonia solani TaxID=456999 RepID=A0A0K6G6E2_9AGAM|nr:Protein priB [Lentinula edodes] [Rhizoctonia solani]